MRGQTVQLLFRKFETFSADSLGRHTFAQIKLDLYGVQNKNHVVLLFSQYYAMKIV